MANTLGSVVLQLAVDTARWQGDLGRAAAIAEARMRRIRETAARTIAQLSVIGTAVASALSVAFKAAVERAADMKDLAEATGVTTETMSRLGYAAAQSGTSIDKVAKALQTLAASGAADPVESLYQLADQFSKMPDSALKTAQAVEVFGKKIGPELIPLLNKGREGLRALGVEADNVGATISTSLAGGASEFQDSIAGLKGLLTGFSNTLAQELLPSLNEMIAVFKDSAVQTTIFKDAAAATANILRFLASAVVVVGSAFNTLGKDIGAAAAAFRALISGDLTGFFDVFNQRAADFEAEMKARKAALDAIWKSGNDPAANAAAAAEAERRAREGRELAAAELRRRQQEDAAKQSAKAVADSVKEALQNGEAALRAAESPGERLQREFRELYDWLEKLKEADSSRVEEATRAQERLAAMYQQDYDDLQRNNGELERSAENYRAWQAVIAATRTPAEQLADEVQRLNELFLSQTDADPEVLRRAIEQAVERSKQGYDQMTVFAEQAARNMQSAFADFLFDPLQNSFKDTLAGFLDMIRRMVAEIAAQQILTQFFGWLSGLGGLWGSVGSAALGGLKTRAMGGPVMAGGTYLVGENGPELLQMGTANGRIVPTGGFTTGGTSSNVTVSYHIDARGADADRIMAIMPGMMRQTEQRTIAQVRELIARGRLA